MKEKTIPLVLLVALLGPHSFGGVPSDPEEFSRPLTKEQGIDLQTEITATSEPPLLAAGLPFALVPAISLVGVAIGQMLHRAWVMIATFSSAIALKNSFDDINTSRGSSIEIFLSSPRDGLYPGTIERIESPFCDISEEDFENSFVREEVVREQMSKPNFWLPVEPFSCLLGMDDGK